MQAHWQLYREVWDKLSPAIKRHRGHQVRTYVKQLTGILVLAAIGSISLAMAGDGSRASRSIVEYVVPDVKLVRDDGKSVSLPDELNDGRPVVLSFIFTTCTSICPLITQTLARLQDALGADRDRVHIVSISIDPEEDTPEVLTAYAKRYHAGPEWRHYTGTMQAIISTAKAFGAYRGDKMSHTPLTLLRKAPGKPWIRFDGFATAEELLQEIRSEAVASR